jgi:hypothetical protein
MSEAGLKWVSAVSVEAALATRRLETAEQAGAARD